MQCFALQKCHTASRCRLRYVGQRRDESGKVYVFSKCVPCDFVSVTELQLVSPASLCFPVRGSDFGLTRYGLVYAAGRQCSLHCWARALLVRWLPPPRINVLSDDGIKQSSRRACRFDLVPSGMLVGATLNDADLWKYLWKFFSRQTFFVFDFVFLFTCFSPCFQAFAAQDCSSAPVSVALSVFLSIHV
jgi:hypothetical protein